jgi:hypothetical protein
MDLNVKVLIHQSEGVAALGIPRDRLEAIATGIAQIGMADPHWSKQQRYPITMAYEWGPTPLSLFVRRDEVKFEVMIMLKREVEQRGFRLKEE